MSYKLARYFIGINIGDVCIGTVHFHGLNANRLQRKGIIRKERRDNDDTYIFQGFHHERKEDKWQGSPTKQSQRNDEE